MLNPGPIVDFHALDYTRPWQVAALIEALESDQVSMLVLRRTHDFLWQRAPRQTISNRFDVCEPEL